jgi:hypothetical protein
MLAAAFSRLGLGAAGAAGMPWAGPATVAKVYLGAPAPHWPKPTLDQAKEVAEVEARLAEVERKNADSVRFIGGELLRTAEEVSPWLAKTGEVDGLLIVPVAQPTPPLAALLKSSEAPALIFSRPYATHAWSSVAGFRAGGRKVEVVASSSYGDLDPYMRMFRTVHHMKGSKALVGMASPAGRQATADAYAKQFGTQFQFVSRKDLEDAFRSVREQDARQAAEEFIRGALRVVEPTRKEIEDGLRFYLALGEMLRRERANAFTIDCFGSLPAPSLPAYPCIAWSKLNDAGLYGVCEADLNSLMTQMLVTSYSGMPGFVSDPVFDVSRNEVIHAHCVAATKMKGIDGPSYPYIIRNHLETNEGAVLQVLMPSAETITVARFSGPRRMLVSTAEVTGPVTDSDRGCRTQIRTRVSDADKWLQSFSAGLHRVIFYGDHVRSIERMGRLMGFEVVREI